MHPLLGEAQFYVIATKPQMEPMIRALHMGIPTGFRKSSVHETLTGSEPEFVSVFLLPHPTRSQSKIISSVQRGQCLSASRLAQYQQNRHTQRTALYLVQF